MYVPIINLKLQPKTVFLRWDKQNSTMVGGIDFCVTLPPISGEKFLQVVSKYHFPRRANKLIITHPSFGYVNVYSNDVIVQISFTSNDIAITLI